MKTFSQNDLIVSKQIAYGKKRTLKITYQVIHPLHEFYIAEDIKIHQNLPLITTVAFHIFQIWLLYRLISDKISNSLRQFNRLKFCEVWFKWIRRLLLHARGS